MKTCDTLVQAQYIYDVGQKIRNRFFGNLTKKIVTGSQDIEKEIPSPPQLVALDITIAHGRITITELSKIMGVSPPSASAMVDRMVNRGLLHRERSAEDRRKVFVKPTPETKENFGRLQEITLASIVGLIEKIGPETTKKWCEVLNEIERAYGLSDSQ